MLHLSFCAQNSENKAWSGIVEIDQAITKATSLDNGIKN